MPHSPDDDIANVLALVSAACGVAFSAYKAGTIRRRVMHRMLRVGSPSVADYEARLRASPAEIEALFAALLIKTTAMFREPAAFSVLRDVALPELFERRAGEGARTVRAWVPACATGEEAFSLAMCLDEAAARHFPVSVGVLASDVDHRALASLARGVVHPSSVHSVPSPFMKWLERHDEHYRIAEPIRALVTSDHHDVLGSELPAPRSAILASFDVVSCRNLLIYLRREAQQRLLERLMKSCADGAILVLGEAELPLDEIEGLRPFRVGVPVFQVNGAPS